MILFTELYQLVNQLKTLDFVGDYSMHVEHKEHLVDVHDKSLSVLLFSPPKNKNKSFVLLNQE